MNTITPLWTSLWSNPRHTVHHLDQSPPTQFRLIAGLAFLYFIQTSIFVLSLEKLTLAPLLSLKGLLLIIYSLATFEFGTVAAVYAATVAFWMGAKCLQGGGGLPQTRAAVVWALVWSIPLGFFLLLIYFRIRNPNHGDLALSIRIASYLAVVANLIYGFIVLVTTISEAHRFGLWRAFVSVLLGLGLLGFALFVLRALFTD